MTVRPFTTMRPVEDRIWRAVTRAAETHARAIDVDAAALSVRGAFLAWLLAGGAAKASPLLVQLTLFGASVDGPLELQGLRLTLTPRFVGCKLRDVDLRDAKIIGFEVWAGSVETVRADRLASRGSLAIRMTLDRDPVSDHYRGTPTIERQLRLNGATIRGNLDLRGCTILGQGQVDGVALFADGLKVDGSALLSNRFVAMGEVRLGGCRIARNLDFSGATLRARCNYSLFAKGSQISGSLHLCRTKRWSIYPEQVGFESSGIITVEGARIDGNFDCAGGLFLAPKFATWQIATPRESDDDPAFTINAAGVMVHRDVLLCDGFRSKGAVCLINARIESDLLCNGGYFDYPADDALQCDGVDVAGTTFFKRGDASRPARSSGFINLRYGTFKQSLQIDGLEFAGTGSCVPTNDGRTRNCGIDFSFGTIGGKLSFKNARKSETSNVELDLCQTMVDVLEDDADSLSVAAILNLSGCQYKAMTNPDARSRLALLDEHYGIAPPPPRATRLGRLAALGMKPLRALDGAVRTLTCAIVVWILRCIGRPQASDPRSLRFDPQPYLQLARIMEQSGYADAATRIRIRLEANFTRLGDFGFWKLLGRYILAITIRYGYRPSYAVFWLLFWTGITWAALMAAPLGQISKANAEASGGVGRTPPSELSYSPLLYALDSLLPIVDLHQKSRWVIEPPHCAPWTSPAPVDDGWTTNCFHWLTAVYRVLADPLDAPALIWEGLRRSALPLLGVINPFLGWALTSLFVAGASGLVRRS